MNYLTFSPIVRRSNGTKRNRPFGDFEQLSREIESLAGSIFTDSHLSELREAGNNTASNLEIFDAYETKEAYVFVAPLPGSTSEDFQIEATQRQLSVKGESKPYFEGEDATQVFSGAGRTRTGKFESTYRLPSEIDPDQVVASYENGVLKITLPKAKANKPIAVQVNAK